MMEGKPAPSRWWYAVAAGVFVLGLASFVGSLRIEGQRMQAVIAEMPRVTLPSGGEVALDEPGVYTLFYEGDPHTGIPDGDRIMPEADLAVAALGTGSGATPLELTPTPEVNAYFNEQFDGYSVFSFDAPTAGRYRIDGQLVDHPDRRFTMAIGKWGVRDSVGRINGVFGGSAVFAFAFVLAAVMAVVIYILRNKGLAEKRA